MIMLSDAHSDPMTDHPRPDLDRAIIVLVQGHLVISSFANTQVSAALDLARVLCRALGQPVELFRVSQMPIRGLCVGMEAPVHDPSWQALATVHPALPNGVTVAFSDDDLRLQHAGT